MRRLGGRLITVCVFAGSTLAITACSAGSDVEPRPDVPTSVGSVPPQAPADAEGHTDEDSDFPPPAPAPTADAASDTAAAKTAAKVMRAFARPKLSPAAWWKGLQPLLTPAAAVAYQGTDPANVPASKVTGRPTLAASTSAYLARVKVPTDAGVYVVLLVREGAGAPWLAERITPPKGAGP